jgi:peroxiredoxin
MFQRILILVIAIAGGLSTTALAAPRVGETAPEVSAKTLDGQSFDLRALRGRVVVINVWATWCGPCRQEMPALDAIYRRTHERGLDMIGLSADKPRDQAKVRRVMAAFSYPAATADQTRASGLTPSPSLPVTYVVDTAGRIRAILSGGPPLTANALEKVITPLMEEARP